MKVLGIRPNELVTRQAANADRDFAWGLYTETVKPIISKLTKRPWTDATERERFSKIWNPENSQIILLDGADIGWFTLSEGNGCVIIEQFYIEKSHQRKGIGGILINFITSGAAKTGRKVVAETLMESTGSLIFEKFGFSKVGETDITKRIEWNDSRERNQKNE